jgi:hypothetical protein
MAAAIAHRAAVRSSRSGDPGRDVSEPPARTPAATPGAARVERAAKRRSRRAAAELVRVGLIRRGPDGSGLVPPTRKPESSHPNHPGAAPCW